MEKIHLQCGRRRSRPQYACTYNLFSRQFPALTEFTFQYLFMFFFAEEPASDADSHIVSDLLSRQSLFPTGCLFQVFILPFQGEGWGSNPRRPEPQSGTLPAELPPPY